MKPSGRRSRKNASASAGVYSTTPSVPSLIPSTFVVMSRKKHVLNVAASSGLSGGVRRVFTGPANGTFAISASAHVASVGGEVDAESMFIQHSHKLSKNPSKKAYEYSADHSESPYRCSHGGCNLPVCRPHYCEQRGKI